MWESPSQLTVGRLLEHGADDAPALGAPGRDPLTYEALRTLVIDTAGALAEYGIGPGDRVAMVVENGPEMAAAFLAVAASATAAPLNPAYRTQELELSFTDLRARLVIVGEGVGTAATDVAAVLGIPVARLVAHRDKPAGTFTLDFGTTHTRATRVPRLPTSDDVALVLHTSGTTSRPKVVPLSHRNLCASARHVRASLDLTVRDRGLVIMPLFHIHGLVAGVLAPIASGGQVWCVPKFNALEFFGWLDDARPTWYTGVPTMHQAILMRAPRNTASIQRHRLRFIRSSSMSMPVKAIEELERVFGVPVIEAYGMTEATHQIASNPLPPRPRCPGSVGPSGGPEIRIVDESGATVPAGEPGEIVIRGPNVITAYENNPEANASSFHGDWLRTGDLGTMDAAGYVTIIGRLKEQINRGGEKIAPREIDEILMRHPAVHQCVTFGTPHELLGQEVAAAIVLKQGAVATEKELRQFAAARLVDFKVPKKVLILAEIPLGPTGKVQRVTLAAQLGMSEPMPPRLSDPAGRRVRMTPRLTSVVG